MSKLYYDFHIHSCLSPCGDKDMTPNNIAGMCKLNGLHIIALTDHNSTKNCPAFFEAAKRYGLVPVAGMELTTAEDIHILCLFETLEGAREFDAGLQHRRILIPNRTDIFGDQLILDGEDRIIGKEEYLLPNATDIPIEEVPALTEPCAGICLPAHIDRPANGVIATLGTFPEEPAFKFAELHDATQASQMRRDYPVLNGMPFLVASDAHYLEQLREAENTIELFGETDAQIRKHLFEKLKEGTL